MKKAVIVLVIFAALVSCTDKKKSTTTGLDSGTKVELEQVENSIDEISKEVKTKSKELDDALSVLENI